MISRILGAIRAALASSVRALCAWGDDVLSMPWHMMQAARDAVYGAPPPSPVIEDVEAAGPKPAGPVAQRRDMVERGLLPLDLEPGPDGIDPLGKVVWQYACNPAIRGSAKLDKLSPDQRAWLLSLSNSDLDRLADAGARVCSKLVRGERTAAISMQPCGRSFVHAQAVDDRADVQDRRPTIASFAERLERITVTRRVKRDDGLVPAFG